MQQDKQKLPFAAIFLAGFWPLLGVLDLVKNWVAARYACRDFDWAFSLTFVSEYAGVWLLLSYSIYRCFIRFEDWPWHRQISVQFFCSVVFGFLHTFLLSLLFSYYLYDVSTAGGGFWEYYSLRAQSRFFPSMLNSTITYWVALILLSAFYYYEKYREQSIRALRLEAELTNSHLQALRMQVQPHFLFNAHNTIAMLIRNGQSQPAVDMISGLSDLLRTTLTRSNRQLIPLQEELDLLKKYLAIEKTRFEDRLNVAINVSGGVENALVPNLILQPIIENAFKHGIAKYMGDCDIQIDCQKHDQLLRISIFNSGPLLPENWDLQNNSGIGLSNVIERLHELYGESYRFDIINAETGVVVKLEFPFRSNGANQ